MLLAAVAAAGGTVTQPPTYCRHQERQTQRPAAFRVLNNTSKHVDKEQVARQQATAAAAEGVCERTCQPGQPATAAAAADLVQGEELWRYQRPAAADGDCCKEPHCDIAA